MLVDDWDDTSAHAAEQQRQPNDVAMSNSVIEESKEASFKMHKE